MSPLNCFTIDDEPYSLNLTSKFVEQTPFLKLAGKFDKPLEGMNAMQDQRIDLLFLDIEMPDLNGLELATLLNENKEIKPPLIVFTTAFDSFAIKSYRLNALDYLLKPFSYEDFLRSATRALRQTSLSPEQAIAEAEHIFIKSDYNLIRVDLKDILYIESQKDYIKIHTRNSPKPISTLSSLKSLEDKLPAHRFMRVHRSHIVSLNYITLISKTSLRIGTAVIPLGEQFKEAIQRFVEGRTA